jgi:hypothetical protein
LSDAKAIGLFRIDEEDIETLVINIWLVVKFWFAWRQPSRPKATRRSHKPR